MLVISRRANETIVVNDNIRVTVVEIRGDKVRLGVVAPRDVPVHRQEVYEAVHGRDHGEMWISVPAQSADRNLIEEIDRRIDQGSQVRFTAEGGFFVE